MKNRLIVNGIIKNEIKHIQETSMSNFITTNEEYKNKDLITKSILEKIKEDIKVNAEQQQCIEELEESIINQISMIYKFYFQEGLKAGLTNLKYLENIDNIEYLL